MSTEKRPTFNLRLSNRASNYLLKLDRKTHTRILDGLEILKANPFKSPGIRQLHGKMQGRYRIRIGPYRVIYEINKDENIVIILFIGPRGDIYK